MHTLYNIGSLLDIRDKHGSGPGCSRMHRTPPEWGGGLDNFNSIIVCQFDPNTPNKN